MLAALVLAVPASGKGKPKPKPKPKPVVTKPVVKPVVPAAPTPKRNGKIAWARDGDIWLMNADGSGKTQLTSSTDDAPVSYATPSWSPDGSKLAYVGTGESGVPGVYVSDADGQNRKRIVGGSDPAWSPDGKQIAYRREAVDNQPDTTVIASATGCAQAGTTGADDSTPSFAWNFALAFTRSDDNGDQDIFARPKGGSAKDLTANPDVNDFSPGFSPDGNKIVFVSDRDGNAEIYAMSADGSHQVNLTKDPPATDGLDCDPEDDACGGTFPPDDTDPAWQPL